MKCNICCFYNPFGQCEFFSDSKATITKTTCKEPIKKLLKKNNKKKIA
ncbi:MAG: hypothetical protein ACOCP8_08295 [archaeon]